MEAELKELQRYGKVLIKLKDNVIGTRHLFVYLYKNFYFHFAMLEGKPVDINNRELKGKLKGAKSKGKYFNEYYNSPLNSVNKKPICQRNI